jgi:hypothetical protein
MRFSPITATASSCDVPPPEDGVRRTAAYRETWPPFFTWQQRQRASFEIVSLDVAAGEDVAFAYALLRCGTPEEFERDPSKAPADSRTAAGRRPLGGYPRTPLAPRQDLTEGADRVTNPQPHPHEPRRRSSGQNAVAHPGSPY